MGKTPEPEFETIPPDWPLDNPPEGWYPRDRGMPTPEQLKQFGIADTSDIEIIDDDGATHEH